MTGAKEGGPAKSENRPAGGLSGGLIKALVDIGPIAAFIVTYNIAGRYVGSEALFVATAVFMAATAISLACSWIIYKRVSAMALVCAVVVGLFGGLTLVFHDALFIRIKPTIINLLYAAVLLGGLAAGRNVWKMLLSSSLSLPDRVWDTLAMRWGIWFIVMAVLNEAVWRNFSEEFWVHFKLWGVMPATVAFALANLPLIAKHHGDSDTAL